MTAEVVGGLLMFEGDIVLGEVADFDAGGLAPQSIFRDQSRDYRWPGGVVPFDFAADVTTGDQAVLNAAMTEWAARVPALRFVPRTNEGAFIRFERRDGVTDRCSSSVGRTGGMQRIWLMETGPCSKFTMVHELGHALGLWHEQSREDRDEHVTVHVNNIQSGREGNFSKHVGDGLDIGPYDFGSLMHYGRDAFCRRNGVGTCVGPTITPKPAGVAIGQRTHLSAGDIAAVRWLYLRNWIVSDSGEGAWRSFGDSPWKTSDLATGDFNGDGRTDLFIADPYSCIWYVAYTQAGGQAGPWETLSSGKCESQSVLRFGDFDGDRKTDVFVTSGGVWYLSKGGVDWWTELNSSRVSLVNLAFADFDGDTLTDVMYGNGRTWYVSYGGASPWTEVNTSGFTVPDLRFGDFDGDGRADVLRATGSEWLVSYGGVSEWTYLNTSQFTLGSLRLGDFNGDGRTDLYRPAGGGWRVSYSGSEGWQSLPSPFKLPPRTGVNGFLFGDFNGDGRKDVFATIM